MKLRRKKKFQPFVLTIESEKEFRGLWDIAEGLHSPEADLVKDKLSNLITHYDWVSNEESEE